MTYTLTRDDGLTISDDPALLDIDRICAWLAASYWANERDRATIERSIEHSRPYGVYAPDGAQIALARVTTDLASFAWIGDVVVDDACAFFGSQNIVSAHANRGLVNEELLVRATGPMRRRN